MATIDLKLGMPETGRAINTLNSELRRAKVARIHVVKIIHGWGSTGVGGSIKVATLKELRKKKKSGFISEFITGDKLDRDTDQGRYALEKYPELKKDRDFEKDNIGITLVVF